MIKSNKLIHTHPYTILLRLKQLLLLLLFPLARGLYNAIMQKGVAAWLDGAKYDIFVLAAALFFATLYWWVEQFAFDESGIYIRRGVIFREVIYVPADNITIISYKAPLFLKPMMCVHLSGDTNAGTPLNYDFSLYIFKKDGLNLLSERHKDRDIKESKAYDVRGKYTLLQAALSSNSIAGAVLLFSFFSTVRVYIGKELEMTILNNFVTTFELVNKILSSTFTTILLLIALSWFIGFMRNVFYYANLTIDRDDEFLTVTHGFFSKRYHQITPEKINYISSKQTLLTKFFKLNKLSIHASGFGKERNNEPILVPGISNEAKNNLLHTALREFEPSEKSLAGGGSKRFLSYLGKPISLLAICYVIGFATIYFVPSWLKGFIFIVTIISSIPLWFMFIIRVYDMKTAGIGEDENAYTLYFSTSFNLNQVVIPKEKVASINIYQNIFNRIGKKGKCNVKIYPFGETQNPIKIRGLFLDTTLAFFP